MKRVLSVLLVIVCLMGCAVADGADDDINKMLTTLYWMYTTDKDLDIKYIDMAASYMILEYDTHLFTTLRILEFQGMEEVYESGFKGWIEIINYICEARLEYSDGKITKAEYANKVFSMVKVYLDTAK